jgi:hypothetical protein
MNLATHSEVVRQADQDKVRRGQPIVDTLLQDLRSNDPPIPRNRPELCVPDDRAMDTFTDGAGI